MRTRRFLSVSILVLAATLPSHKSLARSSIQTPALTAATVELLVTVTDKKGKPVAGLRDADFRIFEDGKAQPITDVSDASKSPLSIVLLMDISMSTTRDSTAKVADAAMKMLQSSIRVGQDRVALVTFNTEPFLTQDFTDDSGQLSSKLKAAKPGGGTAMFDALVASSRLLAREKGRKVVFLISDGEDVASRASLEEGLEAAQRANVAVVAIFPRPSRPRPDQEGGITLARISEETGGFFLDDSDLKQFDKLRDQLHAQYSIRYQPQNPKMDGKYRKIRVETKDKDYRVRNRTGYYAGR